MNDEEKAVVVSAEEGGDEDLVMAVEPKSIRTNQDALGALQSTPAPKAALADPAKVKRDEYIMDTNNSSIVSKRSVEKLYYSGEPEYFRYFVSKFKRRSPLINRGYWLRMKAIEHCVTRFLAEGTAKRKVVINLGCGYDPLPWLFLGKHPELCQNTTFVDVDYPALMHNKLGIISKTEQLKMLLPKMTRTNNESGLLASSDPYVAIGCDLYNTSTMDQILHDHLRIKDSSVAVLCVAEVSIAYMEREAAQHVLEWGATLSDVRFCLLEQHLPDGEEHPFAQTMLAHFQKLKTPLGGIGTIPEMKQRFADAGWPEAGTDIRSLWELWSDPTFLNAEQRRGLDKIEPFDEWEEFALFASHYFLAVAERKADQDWSHRPYRASLAGSTSRVSLAGSGNESPVPDVPQEQPLQCPDLPGKFVSRRYAAVVPATSEISEGEAVGLLGGLGTQERQADCDTYSRTEDLLPIQGPPLRTGIMCHTVTRLGATSNCLMAGGRTSPDKATAECWLRQDGMWRRAQSLPEGRYRHCAIPLKLPTNPRPAHTALIFGGKTSDGHVLDEWLLWMGEGGWRTVHVAGDAPPARFGAAMITDSREGTGGVLVGGMTSAGRVLTDFWHWSLESDMTLYCRNVTARASAVLRTNAAILGRFGAQLVRTNRGILMVGGICGGRMLNHQDEILNMKTLRTHPVQGKRPLFIGSSITDVDGGLIVLGGGANCFSFGTYWNKPAILTDSPEASLRIGWHLLSTQRPDSSLGQQWDMAERSVQPMQSTTSLQEAPLQTNGHISMMQPELRLPEPTKIQRQSLAQGVEFERCVESGQPMIFFEGDIGPCTTMWDNSYLKESIGHDRKVVVHSTQNDTMDFKNKNFQYVTQSFGSFLDSCAGGEKLYLRSLSKDAPSDQPTNLADDYPEIAADFELPGELIYVVENLHSSPLRISGPVTMWLHYDVMANVLCQVRGRKRLLLYPPTDVSSLGFDPGASSSSMDVFNVQPSARRALINTHPYEAILNPGDILFIPPMWVHTAAPTDGMSIAVNIFFRSLQQNTYAAGRDVYGNRDLAAYERGRKDIDRIVKSFENLPADVSGFYLERLANELMEKAKAVSNSSQLHTMYAELS
ncbi:tRNA methyltransferase ppm2 [Recurvomyces mirabilis]|uniref:tRNA wybutosine-synthesizing protein 4 n=1 Tax=Recurvomyces mirabilis TaxID=574656 RepID=A0AAE0WUE2_9PEZI|nr:tRNA methyltransferase ppm2 [Recurvomyces mirabilis]KAK5160565.1 tRNA methyltransferase ppm2 [Recurvomyces mirabilis]